MSEMVDRVAKAIQAKCKDRGYPECPAPLVHHIAAAAIEAMLEPDEVMIQRAYEAVEFDDRWQIEDGRDFLKAYHAVINAALATELAE